ncbi:MAG: hypothetical protein AAFN77_02860 [Planctomycetota bacterium]
MRLENSLGWIVVLLCGSTLFSSSNAIAQERWYKGNLHTHSLWSDGNDFPEMIAKWYVEHDYQFLALTDHNILSEGERWMKVQQIDKRGGKDALRKYLDAMGDAWVETRMQAADDPKSKEVRLKTLKEFRGKFEKAGEFLMIPGEEISDQVNGLPIHMNATNLVELIRPAGGSSVQESIRANMRSAIEQAKSTSREILVHLNHPNFGWAVTAEDIAGVLEENFFEVYNAHPSVNQLGDKKRPGLEKIWDIANTLRIDKLKAPPLLGLATDDSHNYHGRPGSQPGRGWIMVKAEKLEPDSIVRAIKAGSFYASSGVTLNEIQWDPKTNRLDIEIQPVAGHTFTTRFIGTPSDYDTTSQPQRNADGEVVSGTRVYSKDVGKTFSTQVGVSPSYQLTGKELYVRAVITSSAKHPNPSFADQLQQAWVQPVMPNND